MKSTILTGLLFLLILSGLASEENTGKIAILGFQPIDVRNEIAKTVTETLTTRLADSKHFEIVERTQLSRVLDELELSMSEGFEEKTVLRIGKLLKTRTVLIGSVSKIGTRFVINTRLVDVETSSIIFGKSRTCDSENELLSATRSLADEIIVQSGGTVPVPSIGPAAGSTVKSGLRTDFTAPEYILFDTFDTFDRTIWTGESVNDEITVTAEDGKLHFTGTYREGRLNSINSLDTKPFKPATFAVEISFRDVLRSSTSISLFAGNVDWRYGNSLQLLVHLEKEYYMMHWSTGTNWHSDENFMLDELFGDESTAFHTLKLAWDKDTKTAYGYVDDKLIAVIPDFSFVRTDRIYFSVSVNESVSNKKKNVHVELDNFRSSVDVRQ